MLATINSGNSIILDTIFIFIILAIPSVPFIILIVVLRRLIIHFQDMADNKGKDQPPAYMSEDYHESKGSRPVPNATTPHHSTRASKLLQATKTGTYTTSQYLELTFSIMVGCCSTFEPVVIAIDEDYDTLLDDFDSIFRQILPGSRPLGLKKMKIVWENGWKESWTLIGSPEVCQWHSTVKTGNLIAMLRLLKSQSGMNYIEID